MALLLLLVPLLIVAALLGGPLWTAHQRRRLRAQPFPALWQRMLQRRVPYLQRLPVALRTQWQARVQVFLAEVAFVGCRGLEVTEEMRVTIAAQACLLVMQRGDADFERVRQVLLYRDAFRVRREHTAHSGVVSVGDEALAGESWSQGQVVLSWQDTLDSAAVTDDGYNVVLHEFAHQLDDAHGLSLDLDNPDATGTWAQTLGAAYRRLQRQVERGEPTLLDPYGASDPAEFVAVATEAFFEQARDMAQAHPALYGALQRFYRLDPAAW